MPFPTWETPPLGYTFVSRLPRLQAGFNPAGGAAPIGWAQGAIENGTVLAGQLAQQVQISAGWPEGAPPLGDLIGTAKKIVQSALDDHDLTPAEAVELLLSSSDLLRATLALALEQLQQPIANLLGAAGSAIPVVGWLVQLGKIAFQAVKLAHASNPPRALGTPLGYERDRDEVLAQRIMDTMGTDDWTPIWTPDVGGWGKVTLAYTASGEIDGFAFGPGVSIAELAGDKPIAALPGMAGKTWAGFGGYFQGPAVGQNGGRALGVPTITVAALCPSANQLAGLAWAFLGRGSPKIGALDFGDLRKRWGEWQEQGLRFHGMLPDKGGRDSALRTMVRAAVGDLPSGLYPASSPVAAQIAEQIDAAERQFRRLTATLAVAYIPDDAPAMRDREQRSRVEAMRKLLLEHPARYDVDLSIVRQGPWRQALVASRKTPEGIGLKTPGKEAPGRRDRLQPLDGGPAPERPRLPGEEESALSSAAGLAALVAALVWILL